MLWSKFRSKSILWGYRNFSLDRNLCHSGNFCQTDSFIFSSSWLWLQPLSVTETVLEESNWRNTDGRNGVSQKKMRHTGTATCIMAQVPKTFLVFAVIEPMKVERDSLAFDLDRCNSSLVVGKSQRWDWFNHFSHKFWSCIKEKDISQTCIRKRFFLFCNQGTILPFATISHIFATKLFRFMNCGSLQTNFVKQCRIGNINGTKK